MRPTSRVKLLFGPYSTPKVPLGAVLLDEARDRDVVFCGLAEFVAAGRGEPFDPGHGRLMREWLEVAAGSEREWLSLAQEAMRFVAPEPIA